MKKTIKIVLIILILLTSMQSCAYARWNWDHIRGLYNDDSAAMDTEISIGNSGAESSSVGMTQRIFSVLQLIGSIASVIALVVIGFRYMFSSVEEQAKMKGVMIYYVVGAVLVFATSNILSVVYKAISDITL